MNTSILKCGVLAALALGACAPPGATVGGTIYLQQRSGEVLHGAALPVKLLSLSDVRRQALGEACAHDQRSTDTIAFYKKRMDSVSMALVKSNMLSPGEIAAEWDAVVARLFAEADRQIAVMLVRFDVLVTAETVSDEDGAYIFEEVPDGEYIVHAFWKRSADVTNWTVPVTLSRGRIVLDLNNVNAISPNNLMDQRLRCP